MTSKVEQFSAWYNDKVENLPEETRRILEDYSGLASNDVLPHVERVRRNAFEIVPYPCIGQCRFLNVALSKHPLYPEIVNRVKSGQNFMDIGCCFGTDIRKLIVDGASAQHVFGVDLEQDFLDQGFELYRDADKLPKTSFIAENMLQQTFSPSLDRLKGGMSIVYLSSVFHLFDIHEQMQLMRKVLKLLKQQPGSLIIGRQIGNTTAGPYKKRVVKEDASAYYHNGVSIDAMMKLLGAETGTTWVVESVLDEKDYIPKDKGPGVEKSYPWYYEGCKNHVFSARLV